MGALEGVEVGTEKVWAMLEEFKLPRLLIINKLDRENSNFKQAMESIQQFFGRQAILVQIPIGEETDFSGVVDLIGKKAYLFEKNESGTLCLPWKKLFLRLFTARRMLSPDLYKKMGSLKYIIVSLAKVPRREKRFLSLNS